MAFLLQFVLKTVAFATQSDEGTPFLKVDEQCQFIDAKRDELLFIFLNLMV